MASAWQVDVWQYAQDYAPTVEALGGAASAMLFSHAVPVLALLFGAVLGLLLVRPGKQWLNCLSRPASQPSHSAEPCMHA